MKKFSMFAICLMFLCCSFLFVGCNKDNDNNYEKQGFVAICSVSYEYKSEGQSGINNVNKLNTLNSYYAGVSNLPSKEITSEEFRNLDHKNPITINMNANKDNKPMHLIGKQFGTFSDLEAKYYIHSITDIKECYLYIKIININQIEIIEPNGNHFLINTNYYNIEYFK